MAIHDDPSRKSSPLDEQLVAYLDGELEHEDRRRMEDLLASDAHVRRRLQELEQTWNLLDDLDAAPAGGQFTESTLEMVAVAAQKDIDRAMVEAPRRRWRRLLMLTAALVAAGALGFLGMALTVNPNRQILQELPVLEDLDAYRHADSIEFLRLLRDKRLFAKESRPATEAATPMRNETLAERQRRIESMDLDKKQELLRLKERFDSFDQDQRRRLTLLYNAMQTAPDALELRQIMFRYGQWLQNQPSYTRTELADAKPADRAALVEKRLAAEQTRDDIKRLNEKDAKALRDWMGDYVSRHREQVSAMLSDWQKKYLAELPPGKRPSAEFLAVFQRRQGAGEGGPPILLTAEDLKRLAESLSPEKGKELKAKPLNEQRQLVAEWVRQLARQRYTQGPLSKPNDDRLAHFFENVLSDAERDRLLSMPGEEMQRELQWLYLTRARSPEGARFRPDAMPRGRRQGGDRLPPTRPEKAPPSREMQEPR
jgi:hypothetical protein